MFNKSIFLLLFSLSNVQATKIINETEKTLEIRSGDHFSSKEPIITMQLKPGASLSDTGFRSFTATAKGLLPKRFVAASPSDIIRITSFAGFLLKKIR